jgi:GTP-binding protein HflX
VLRISAASGSGLDEVKSLLEELLRDNKIYVERLIPYENAGILQMIRTQGELIEEEYGQDGIAIKAYVPIDVYGKIQ